MSAIVKKSGDTVQLRQVPSGVREVKLTDESAASPRTVAEAVDNIHKRLGFIERIAAPDFIDFEDVSVGSGGALVRLPHKAGGRVRWYVVDWSPSAGNHYSLRKDETNTTDDELVLISTVPGTATIRVERVVG